MGRSIGSMNASSPEGILRSISASIRRIFSGTFSAGIELVCIFFIIRLKCGLIRRDDLGQSGGALRPRLGTRSQIAQPVAA